ncbi:MAG TPA: hypothetical protein VMI31_11720, partial [Fimbriimonadaceae bacterium]|nr:hypothetical protein [Fimbriimonadaceae bacterium]
WFADYIDPEDFLSLLLTSNSAENHWNYSNPGFDRLCASADRCTLPAERLKLYAAAEDLALGDASMIPLCYWKVPVLVAPRVHGLRFYAGNTLPYSTVTLGK